MDSLSPGSLQTEKVEPHIQAAEGTDVSHPGSPSERTGGPAGGSVVCSQPSA